MTSAGVWSNDGGRGHGSALEVKGHRSVLRAVNKMRKVLETVVRSQSTDM